MIPVRVTYGKWIVYRCVNVPIQSKEGSLYASNYCGVFDTKEDAESFIKNGYKK